MGGRAPSDAFQSISGGQSPPSGFHANFTGANFWKAEPPMRFSSQDLPPLKFSCQFQGGSAPPNTFDTSPGGQNPQLYCKTKKNNGGPSLMDEMAKTLARRRALCNGADKEVRQQVGRFLKILKKRNFGKKNFEKKNFLNFFELF